MHTITQPWQILKDLRWLWVGTVQKQTRPKFLTSQPIRGMKLLIIRFIISKFIPSQQQFAEDFEIYFSIRLFATVTTGQGVLVIGGYPAVATVACYDSCWSKLDDLQST